MSPGASNGRKRLNLCRAVSERLKLKIPTKRAFCDSFYGGKPAFILVMLEGMIRRRVDLAENNQRETSPDAIGTWHKNASKRLAGPKAFFNNEPPGRHCLER